MNGRLDYSYNSVDIALEPELTLREFGYENFRERESNRFYHKKLYHTFQFVERGKGFYFLNGKKYEVGAGSMFYLPPDSAVMYYECPSDPYLYYWFALSGGKAEKAVKKADISLRNPVVRFAEHNRVIGEIKAALADAKNLFAIKGHIYTALSLIFEADSESAGVGEKSDRLFHEIADFIHVNYPQPEIQIQQLLDIFHVSQPRLYRMFSERTGMSPKQYLLSYRMEKAKEMLEKNNSVSNAADSVGYDNVYHFSKQFKRHFGVSPNDVRPREKTPFGKSE